MSHVYPYSPMHSPYDVLLLDYNHSTNAPQVGGFSAGCGLARGFSMCRLSTGYCRVGAYIWSPFVQAGGKFEQDKCWSFESRIVLFELCTHCASQPLGSGDSSSPSILVAVLCCPATQLLTYLTLGRANDMQAGPVTCADAWRADCYCRLATRRLTCCD
jgi:hypothetical protein